MKTRTYTVLRAPKPMTLRMERTGFSVNPENKSMLRRFLEWLERKLNP